MSKITRRDFIKLTGAGAATLALGYATSARAANGPRVVVVGGGFGGATCAKYLKRADQNIQVTLVEPNTKFVTCPFSNYVIGGMRKVESITQSYDVLRTKHGVNVVHDTVTAIDAAGKKVTLKSGKTLPYDRLVVSPGIDFKWTAIAGYSEQDAQDLTQGFFARLLEKGSIGAADRERGRFRTFLLTALQNYLTNEWDRANRQKRGGGQQLLSLEHHESADAGYQLLPPDTASPDQLYERRWAQAVLEAVLRRLRGEFDGRSGGGKFDVLKEFLFSDRGEFSYADAAARLGLSESATKSAIYRLRQRYGQLFADEIAQTVARPEEVDDEIRHLLSALEAS
jgi:DNA-directed RNA polymerase specialized sigma24 family protein